MRPVVIRRFCRPSVPVLILFLLYFSVFLWFLYTGVADHETDMIVISVLLLCIPLVGLGFFLCYGIKITSKYVTVLYHNTCRVFRYKDIVHMEIEVDDESLWGEIKADGEPTYYFYFDEFELDPGSLFSRLTNVKIKIPQKVINNAMVKVSAYKKIRIINHGKTHDHKNHIK